MLNPSREITAHQVSRFLQLFYSAAEDNNAIDYLILGSGTACLPNLAELTEFYIGAPTIIANPFVGMSYSKKVNETHLKLDAPMFLSAAGLAI